ncbi:unnamed protein product [Timema podura]|uniref:Uncharacterized protein n=1 Tax=Timema podura TaxID=61482 RepID=A0ABN7NXZ3_TIMPD|nr:unnamed protein product [Timema podura]
MLIERYKRNEHNMAFTMKRTQLTIYIAATGQRVTAIREFIKVQNHLLATQQERQLLTDTPEDPIKCGTNIAVSPDAASAVIHTQCQGNVDHVDSVQQDLFGSFWQRQLIHHHHKEISSLVDIPSKWNLC